MSSIFSGSVSTSAGLISAVVIESPAAFLSYSTYRGRESVTGVVPTSTDTYKLLFLFTAAFLLGSTQPLHKRCCLLPDCLGQLFLLLGDLQHIHKDSQISTHIHTHACAHTHTHTPYLVCPLQQCLFLHYVVVVERFKDVWHFAH